MKNVLLIILLFGFAQLHAQTKKEQLEMLKTTIDSLNNILAKERNTNSINQKENENLIGKYKTETKLKDDLLNRLNKEMEISQQKTDSIVNELSKEITFLKDSLKNISTKKSKKFTLPYQHGKVIDPNENQELTTVFLNFKNKNYIITDSILSIINETELCFYFLTPVENEINMQCPEEYGIIVLDRDNNEIYSSFWDSESYSELKGNCLPSLNQYRTNNGIRNLLCLGSSGCGSGVSLTYFDVNYNNKKIQFNEALSCGGGYSDFQFIPEKNIYLKIERVNPECHYSCPSKYKISSYSLSTDILIKTSLTKLMYDDYNDIGIETLLKNIQQKENLVIY